MFRALLTVCVLSAFAGEASACWQYYIHPGTQHKYACDPCAQRPAWYVRGQGQWVPCGTTIVVPNYRVMDPCEASTPCVPWGPARVNERVEQFRGTTVTQEGDGLTFRSAEGQERTPLAPLDYQGFKELRSGEGRQSIGHQQPFPIENYYTAPRDGTRRSDAVVYGSGSNGRGGSYTGVVRQRTIGSYGLPSQVVDQLTNPNGGGFAQPGMAAQPMPAAPLPYAAPQQLPRERPIPAYPQ